MKKFTLIAAILIISNLLSAQWVQQNPNYPDVNVLNDLVFFDHSSGWVVGGYGSPYWTDEILHTDNGGFTWEVVGIIGYFHPAQSICFTDRQHGWVCGGGGLMHTNDGGLGWDSWVSQNIPFSEQQKLTLVYFSDPMNGWAYAKYDNGIHVGGELYKTTDGGNNWEEFWSGMVEVFDMYFLNESIGYFVGWFYLYHTTDGGDTWTHHGFFNMNALSLDVIDENNIWIAGYEDNYKGIIKSSNDGGLTWNKKLGDTIPPLNDVTFIDSNNGWAVGDNGTILHTSDGGDNWEFQESGAVADLNSVYFVDENYGWICGDSSIILHTDNGGVVGLEQSVKAFSESHKLEIYPNPITEIATVRFEILKKSNINISIHNQLGQKVEILFEGEKEKGTHKLSWGSKDLSSGIYFVRLQTEGFVTTQKIIKK